VGLTAPASAAEVADTITGLRDARTPGVVVGGGTLLDVADREADGLERIETARLDAVVAYEPDDLTCTIGAGVTLAVLRERLTEGGQSFPVFHPAPDRATLGGLAAFAWTGLGRRLYGRLRDRILEVRAVTGEGKVVRGGAKVVKNVTGFDLPRLLCGSMGTLAVLTELTVKVHPPTDALWATSREGDPQELVRWARSGAERAPVPVEAIVELRGGSSVATAFVPGPPGDARGVLAVFGPGDEPTEGDERFAVLCADTLLAPGESDPDVVVRVAVPGPEVGSALEQAGAVERAIVDVASGVAWLGMHAGRVEALRTFTQQRGGSLVLLRAPSDVRRTLGTWGAPAGGAEIMRRLKTLFDPDDVLGPGRFVV
jgi:glycolate oxidase FAD binding subunit